MSNGEELMEMQDEQMKRKKQTESGWHTRISRTQDTRSDGTIQWSSQTMAKAAWNYEDKEQTIRNSKNEESVEGSSQGKVRFGNQEDSRMDKITEDQM